MEKQNLDKGELICNKNVLYSIVSLATKEINGVVSFSKNPAYQHLTDNKNFYGIKIKHNNVGGIIIDVFINVYSNVKVPEICAKIQENIKNNILTMVDVKTSRINVHVVDVTAKKDEEDANNI